MSAHPTSALIGYTFDTESGKQLALEDILETGDGSSAAEKEIREKFAAALTAGFLDYEYSGDLLQWGRRSAEEIVTGSFLELEESWRCLLYTSREPGIREVLLWFPGFLRYCQFNFLNGRKYVGKPKYRVERIVER